MRRLAILIVFLAGGSILSWLLNSGAGPVPDLLGDLRAAGLAACTAQPGGDEDRIIQGNVFADHEISRRADGIEISVRRLAPGGQLRRVIVEAADTSDRQAPRPIATMTLNAACDTIDLRRLVYAGNGTATRLEILSPVDATLQSAEDLHPPVPAGQDPGGITVALFDSGVNYTIPEIAARLARDAGGSLIGYDFWDLDGRPYDLNTKASPFFPLHHGTTVASVLVREAPDVRLAPFRYPDPDMRRMADMVAAADAAGAVVVAMPMGSNDRNDWNAFLDAARQRPHMLFVVSAGNDDRDIDATPIWPAAAELDNLLVVTSSTPFGKLAVGSNYGTDSVDLMVPAEKIPVIDHRGAPGEASGSSYAVPRVAALAARLLAGNPAWRAIELKTAIAGRAKPSPYQRTRVTKYGWIPNPAAN